MAVMMLIQALNALEKVFAIERLVNASAFPTMMALPASALCALTTAMKLEFALLRNNWRLRHHALTVLRGTLRCMWVAFAIWVAVVLTALSSNALLALTLLRDMATFRAETARAAVFVTTALALATASMDTTERNANSRRC